MNEKTRASTLPPRCPLSTLSMRLAARPRRWSAEEGYEAPRRAWYRNRLPRAAEAQSGLAVPFDISINVLIYVADRVGGWLRRRCPALGRYRR